MASQEEVYIAKRKLHRDAFPRDSNGNNSARQLATRNIAPEIKIGTEVVKLAYSAIIGACRASVSTHCCS
jgi:hypothetical protein